MISKFLTSKKEPKMSNSTELPNRLRKSFRVSIRKRMKKTRSGWTTRSDNWMRTHRRESKL